MRAPDVVGRKRCRNLGNADERLLNAGNAPDNSSDVAEQILICSSTAGGARHQEAQTRIPHAI